MRGKYKNFFRIKLKVKKIKLNRNLDPVALQVQNTAFIIPISGPPGGRRQSHIRRSANVRSGRPPVLRSRHQRPYVHIPAAFPADRPQRKKPRAGSSVQDGRRRQKKGSRFSGPCGDCNKNRLPSLQSRFRKRLSER